MPPQEIFSSQQQPLLQPQLLPQPQPQLPLLPQQQNRMMIRMMIHRQPPPPQPLLQHPIYEYLLFMKVLRWLFAALNPIICAGSKWVRPSQRIFSANARSIVATSARLAFFSGLMVSASVEELLIMPSATAQDRASRAQASA